MFNGRVNVTKVTNDPILEPYSNCTSWKKASKYLKEVELFKNGQEMMHTLKDVSTRLGFQKNLEFGK